MDSTLSPFAKIGEFARLEVVALEEVGAFLDWGLPKNLFLPFAEQLRGLRVGQKIVVFIYTDNTGRPAASMRLQKHFQKATSNDYKTGDAAELLVFSKTDLGYKAIVNGRHQGLLFGNEVFQPIHYGQTTTGYIKKVRDDGKLDLILTAPDKAQVTGHKAALGIGPQILELLSANDGFLDINDKTEAERIYELFGVSKKKFKIALGDLYKKKQITISDDGIRKAEATSTETKTASPTAPKKRS